MDSQIDALHSPFAGGAPWCLHAHIRVDAPREVRKGWFTDASGKMFFQMRYGSKPLEFAKGSGNMQIQLPAIRQLIGFPDRLGVAHLRI